MRIVAMLVVVLGLAGVSAEATAKKGAPLTDEERTVAQVFDAKGYTRDQIYAASKVWIAENFKSAKAVIEYDSKDEATLIGNGRTSFICEGGWVCKQKANTWIVVFKMKIEAKDDRFRLTFTDVHLDGRVCCEMPIKDRDDMDNVKATLLQFGPQIVASLGKANNW